MAGGAESALGIIERARHGGSLAWCGWDAELLSEPCANAAERELSPPEENWCREFVRKMGA